MEASSISIPDKIQPMVCLYKPFSTKRNWLHTSLKQLTQQSLNYETKKICLQELTKNFLPRKKENIYFLKNLTQSKFYNVNQTKKIFPIRDPVSKN